ncbi:MAG: helix-turn-helix domain-containing protein [bacterium]|nr:helix-turn-helix domain-containing protein [bacterium]
MAAKYPGTSYLYGLFLLVAFLPVLFLFPFPISAMEPGVSLENCVTNRWTTADGLPGDSVIAIAQTADGFIWLADSRLLYRFDGVTFSPYPLFRQTPGYYKLTALETDRAGNLRIATQGKGLFHIAGPTVRRFTMKQGLSDDSIRNVYTDSRDKTWLAMENGTLDCLERGKCQSFPHNVLSILEDAKDNLWIGTMADGLYRFQDGTFVHVPLLKDKKNLLISSLAEDSVGNIWLGTAEGIILYNGKSARPFSVEDGLSHRMVYRILADSDGCIWVAGAAGLDRILSDPTGQYQQLNIQKTLRGEWVKTVYEDREKSIWAGVVGKGLVQLTAGNFTRFSVAEGLTNDYVHYLYQDSLQNVWAVTQNEVLRFDGGKVDVAHMSVALSGHEYEAVCRDGKGNTWISGAETGLFRVSQKGVTHFSAKDLLPSQTLTELLCDHRDTLWIGSLSGLIRYRADGADDSPFTNFTTRHGLAHNIILLIYRDPRERLWIGTQKGLHLFRDGVFSDIRVPRAVGPLLVSHIYSEPGGDMWWATLGNGLILAEAADDTTAVPQSYHIFTTQQGLPGNFIYQVFPDSRGYLWLTGDFGIARVARKELLDVAAHKTRRVFAYSYGKRDGLTGDSRLTSHRHSSLLAHDGRLVFGTDNGIFYVDPANMKINKIPPGVIITQIQCNGEAVPVSPGGIELRDVANLSFYFTATSFLFPEDVRFNVKLEGFDPDWRTVHSTDRRQMHYRDVPAGSYTFRVTAANRDGIRDEKGAQIALRITVGFYRTAWFKALAGLVGCILCVLVFFSIRMYLSGKRLKNKYKHSSLTPGKVSLHLKALQRVMELENAYLDENLTLETLAAKVSISPRDLSQLINEQLNKNFRDYVNQYRVDEAIVLLRDSDRNQLNILEIAFKVGFNTHDAFYRAFKKYTGKTPSQFKKKAATQKDK